MQKNTTLKKILIIGGSSDLAQELNKKLYLDIYQKNYILGLHYNKNKKNLSNIKECDRVKKFQKELNSKETCYQLVDDFKKWAGGIDVLIQLSGGINRNIHWEKTNEKDWQYNLLTNLVTPFFIAQRAIKYMKKNGGKILLTSTSSASHGGGTNSLPYGVSKAGIECITKKLAKDCAKYNIKVNAIAPGFIKTKLHTKKIKMTEKQIKDRIEMIPLKRSGTTKEIADIILFLISEKSSYITGQIIPIDGGDWI